MNTGNPSVKGQKSGIGQLLSDLLSMYKIHLICWTVYILYESVLIGLAFGQFGRLENYAVHYALNIFLFYFHAYMLERIIGTKASPQYLVIFLLTTLETLCYIPLLALLNHLFTNYNTESFQNGLGIDKAFALKAAYRGLFFLIYSTGYWFLIKFLRERKKSTDLEESRLKYIIDNEVIAKQLVAAENAYLKAQINPHFLFNTLNFVRRRIRKIDPEAGELIISLTDMMRYALNTNRRQDLILLDEEIDQVKVLIGFFLIKDERKSFVNLKIDGDITGIRIIPLALLTLAENIFKHGRLDDAQQPAEISIRNNNSTLTIQTSNLPSFHQHLFSNKTGLTNLNERLARFYGNQAGIQWSTIDHKFEVVMNIPLID